MISPGHLKDETFLIIQLIGKGAHVCVHMCAHTDHKSVSTPKGFYVDTGSDNDQKEQIAWKRIHRLDYIKENRLLLVSDRPIKVLCILSQKAELSVTILDAKVGRCHVVFTCLFFLKKDLGQDPSVFGLISFEIFISNSITIIIFIILGGSRKLKLYQCEGDHITMKTHTGSVI